MSFRRSLLAVPAVLLFSTFAASGASAQTGGTGAIAGTVVDVTGAVVPGATITVTNTATGVVTTRVATSAGVYNVGQLIPGTYTVAVSFTGFSTFRQENLTLDALDTVGLNITLKNGSTGETITVTDAPPVLETTNATLGGVTENSVYSALPLLISGGQQRDITQFSNLLPGAQVNPGGRSSIIGGTGQRVGEVYVDGLPLTTANVQGDNRPVFNIVPLEAIDQIKVVTSGYSAQYQGAGLENYNLKAGANQYHGSLFAYLRNTIFDAWTFSSKPGSPSNMVPTVTNGVLSMKPGPKPPEHQLEYGYAVGGPIKIPHLINGHDKLFFYTTLDRFRSRLGANYTAGQALPTLAERTGDFRELLKPTTTFNGVALNAAGALNAGGMGLTTAPDYILYDPTSQASCTAHNTGGLPCRYAYGYGPGSGIGANGAPVKTGAPVNVIPASQLSPITQYMQKFLPAPLDTTVGQITNNFSSGVPTGFDNYLVSGRIDYTISPKQTLSGAYNQGQRHAVPYTGSTGIAVVPYISTTLSTIKGEIADVEYTYQITPNLVNQARYGFINFGGPPVMNITGTTNPGLYGFAASGVTNTPAGQASDNFANTAFTGSNAPSAWVGNTPTVTNRAITYEILDNLNLVKGRHSMNFGGQFQWLENNADTADGPSTPTAVTWSLADTGALTNATLNGTNSTNATANTGYSYASFLIGAVGAASTTQQAFSVVGGRFHPAALYFQDDFKINSKLTINAGIRWDYIPPYHEAKNRYSFLAPDVVNPITGAAGALQFAGNGAAGLYCNCASPVNSNYRHFEPRVGFAFQADEKTVFRGGYSLTYSHGGATGGAGGAGTGTGQAGYNTGIAFADTTQGPAFYLNNNPAFSNQNAAFGGPGFALPGTSPISAATAGQGTGYYVTAAGTSSGTGNAPAYADPYVGAHPPEFSFFNFGIQREISRNLTISVDYSGSQSHFIAGAANIRGLYSSQIDPKYLVLGSRLTQAATPANLAAAQAATGLTLPTPTAAYTAFASLNTISGTQGTIGHLLTWKPQYPGTSDPFGIYVANGNYNSLQISLAERAAKGLTFNVNYTYSQNIDDAGTQRSGYDIPGTAIATGQSYSKNRIDRSLSLNDQPQNLSIYGVYTSQYGKGSLLGDHLITRALLGGWQTSLIFQYSSGLPLAIVGTCNATQNVGQGTCMNDVNPNFQGDVRINGKWGQGITAATLGKTQYLQGGLSSGTSGTGAGGVACASSTGPFCNSGNYMVGDAPRFPYGLRSMDVYRLNMALRRQFPINDRLKFILGIDGSNLTNHTTFGSNAGNNMIGVNPNTPTSFGTLNFASGDPRDFQFSGRFSF